MDQKLTKSLNREKCEENKRERTNDIDDMFQGSFEGSMKKRGQFALGKRCISQYTVEPAVVGIMFMMSLYNVLSKEYIRRRLSLAYHLDTNNSGAACNNSDVNMSDPYHILEDRVSSETASWVLYLSLSCYVPALFSCILLGAWSDKVGRKIPLLISIFGLILLMVCYQAVVIFDLPLHFLFIGHISSGFLGYYANVLACAFSHISDIAKVEQRTMRIAVFEISIGLGAFVAYMTSGAWDLSKGYENPFWCMVGIIVLTFVYTAIFVKSRAEGTLRNQLRYLFSKEPFLHMYKVMKPRQDKRHLILGLYAISFGLVVLTMVGEKGLLVVYVTGIPICADSFLVGILSALSNISLIGSLILLKMFPGSAAEVNLVIVGVIASAASCAVLSFARAIWMLFASQILKFPSMLPSPILRSQSSKLVNPEEVGAVFAVLSCSLSIAEMVASLMFEGIYAITVSSALPGGAFLVGTGLMLMFIPLYCIAYRHSSRNGLSQGILYDKLTNEPSNG